MTYPPICCAFSDDGSGVKVEVLKREVAFDIVREVFVFLSTETKLELVNSNVNVLLFLVHIRTFAKDQTSVKIPVDSTARALMSSSRGEGCGREARGVRGARGVRTHPTPIPQLVQVVHLIIIKSFNLLLV